MILLAIVITAVVVFLLTAARLPSEFAHSRSITIAAPVEAVFPEVNSTQRFRGWSPWADLDPEAKTTSTGPESGVGSAMSWDGNGKVGAGRMTLVETVPNSRVRFRLDFERPFKATNTAEFTFRTEGAQTVVTWTMTGSCPFPGKVIGLLMNCQKMMSAQFDKGLAKLKTIAEAKA